MKLPAWLESGLIFAFVTSACGIGSNLLDDPWWRIGVTSLMVICAIRWLVGGINAVRAENRDTKILNPSGEPAVANSSFPINRIAIQIAAFAIAAFAFGTVLWYDVPVFAKPARISSVSNLIDGIFLISRGDQSTPTTTIPFTFPSALTEEIARGCTRHVTGERFAFDVLASKHVPPVELDSVLITVTSYTTIDDFDADLKSKGYRTTTSMANAWNTPMVFVGIDDTEVGKSYSPQFVSHFKDDIVVVKPWDFSQLMLDPDFHQSVVVHVGARKPGVYTYCADVIFKNRLGKYPPIRVVDQRTVRYATPPDENLDPADDDLNSIPTPRGKK